jgi:hypothetical protein
MNSRRFFIKQITGSTVALSMPAILGFSKEKNIPIRAITKGPEFHWFGYYDKLQFDPSNRYVLGMQVDFEMRSPTKDDVIKLGYIDLQNNDKWTTIGESRSWGWQQGCMLQWVPGTESDVIWNDRHGNDFVSIIKNIKTGQKKILPKAVYSLSPDGKYGIGTDFSRIQNYRKGYGYPGGIDPYKDQNAPSNSGIYRMDLKTGDVRLILSYFDISQIPHRGESISEKWHYFNHLLVSPDSKRFIFLNRWRETPISDEILANPYEYNKIRNHFTTRMFTSGIDGNDVFLLDPSGNTSHFIWKDPEHITAWTKPGEMEYGFWEFKDQTTKIRQVGKGKMTQNGHNTYLPGTNNKWILNDTYPQRDTRKQILYLYHEPTAKIIELGRFYQPPEYVGEWRCDLHPRASNNGKLICIDSTHEGNGRQMYLIDINELI